MAHLQWRGLSGRAKGCCFPKLSSPWHSSSQPELRSMEAQAPSSLMCQEAFMNGNFDVDRVISLDRRLMIQSRDPCGQGLSLLCSSPGWRPVLVAQASAFSWHSRHQECAPKFFPVNPGERAVFCKVFGFYCYL